MSQQFYIPDKIKVGFQKRDDTFTKKLAYVIYYDMKGELRKEKSWQGWRDQKIAPQDFENVPTEGFVLNKKVGGYKSSWNYRDAHVRVYDPRDFEFEISVPNLLFILTQCDCSRGKGLEGKFVYAWEGTELVLLPERCEDFQNSKKYTVLQASKVKAKELQPGASYLTKKQLCLTYLGKFDYYQTDERGGYSRKKEVPLSKKFCFWDGKTFVCLDNVSSIAATAELQAPPDLAELTQLYYKGPHGSPIKELFLKDIPKRERRREYWRDMFTWVYEEKPGVYVECRCGYDSYNNSNEGKTPHNLDKVDHFTTRYKYELKDGILIADSYYTDSKYKSGKHDRGYNHGGNHDRPAYRDPTYKAIWARLESGEEYKLVEGSLLTPKEAQSGEESDD